MLESVFSITSLYLLYFSLYSQSPKLYTFEILVTSSSGLVYSYILLHFGEHHLWLHLFVKPAIAFFGY